MNYNKDLGKMLSKNPKVIYRTKIDERTFQKL